MSFADYGCEIGGSLVPIVFERKSIGDLYGTMTSGYARFKKEMERAKAQNFVMELLVEGSMRDVAKGFERSTFEGASMIQKLYTLKVRYNLNTYFFNDRHEMAKHIVETYKAVERNYKPGKKDE